MPPPQAPRFVEPGVGFYAIMFTDIVRSTGLRADYGDDVADRLHEEVDATTREATLRHNGWLVKSLGDGAMALFRGPTDAVQAALAIQVHLARRNRTAQIPLHLRVGVTVGEIDVSPTDISGYSVNEAARICAAAGSGGVLVSEVAAGLTRRSDLTFSPPISVEVTPSAPPTRAVQVEIPLVEETLVPLSGSLEFPQHSGLFVGRGRELAELTASWSRVTSGGVELVILTGEAGIGKTSLLGQFAHQITTGPGLVLYGRCAERTAAPYEPFGEAFTHFTSSCPPADFDRILGEHARQLVRLVPELGERFGTASDFARPDPDSERWQLQEAIGAAVRALCGYEPVLLIIDDLHWAGSTSIEMIERLVRDSSQHHLMVVLSLRPWDPTTDPLVGQLLADRHRLTIPVVEVTLKGLQPTEVGELVAHWSDSEVAPASSESLWSMTAGNPLFISQVLRGTAENLELFQHAPPEVVDVIGRQVERLAAPSQQFLRMAALVGTRFELQVVTVATGLDRGAALDCIEEATKAGFVASLEGVPLRFEFTSDLVRMAVAEAIPVARQRDGHARIAEALSTASGLDPDDRVRRLAFHWSEAGEFGSPEFGVSAGCAAAEIAIRHFAIADAEEYLQRARTLAQLAPDARRDCELLVLSAEAHCLGGSADSRELQLRAVASATALGDSALLSRAALAHSRGYFSQFGRIDVDRIQALQTALDLCSPEDRTTRALLQSRLANEITFDDADRLRFALVDQALAYARESADPTVIASVLSHRQYVLGAPEHLEVRIREGLELARLAEEMGDRFLEMHSVRCLCATATESGDLQAVHRLVDRLVEINEQLELPGARWELASARASRALFAGDIKSASALVREAFALGSAAGQSDAFVFAGAQLMQINWLRGRLASVMDTFLAGTPEEVTQPLVAWVARELHTAGRRDESFEWWSRAQSSGLDRQLDIGVNAGLVLNCWAYMAAVSDRDDALINELIARLTPFEERFFNQLAPDQPGHHFLGLLYDALGDAPHSDEHFLAAVELLDRIGAPVMAAISRVAWAGALHRRGETDAADALARRALYVAQDAGATQIVQDATQFVKGTT